MDILRIITAGNVDDGKSTLIGRLLHDTGNIKLDVLRSLEYDNEAINLARVTDGLRSERAQGITIDVAYKYFTTAKRKYILTDAPGHFQYTKNLVTGASNVDAIIILIDACNGITDQTKRHSLVASFLKIPNVFVVVNKMDAIGYSKNAFEDVVGAFKILAGKLLLPHVTFIPVSALCGDNVIRSSSTMTWYSGKTLLEYLEHCEPHNSNHLPFRFPVQLACHRDQGSVLMGKVASGTARVGDLIGTFSADKEITIHQITVAGRNCMEAAAGESIAIHLSHCETFARGTLIYLQNEKFPTISTATTVALCWLDAIPLSENKEYYMQLNSDRLKCHVSLPSSKFSIDNLELVEKCGTLMMSEIGNVQVHTERAIAFDSYGDNKSTGRGILIDPVSHNTCGAFTIN